LARIPRHKVDEIYNAADILEVVGDYVPLKKKGQNYWALSPFTNEKTPSFAVNPAKGIFKCFSSGKGGNAVQFLIELEGLSYVEALRALAKKYNIELEEEEESPEEKAARDKRESLLIVNEFASRWFHEQMLQSEEGRSVGLSYFKERGILEHSIKSFQLGYAPDSWEAFVAEAEKQQFRNEYLQELGLASTSEKTGKLYDRFRERVMFPISDVAGKVVGFGGRVLTSEKQMAKYINSPESSVYHKSHVLYGLFQAKQHIRNADLCIMTEGYLDVIALHQSGVQHAVASSGTALTTEQVRLIRRFTKNVLMIYDGDAAGIKAALRGIDILLQEAMQARVLVLPDGHDPDSFIKQHGVEAFEQTVKEKALSFIDFQYEVLSDQYDVSDPGQQATLVREMAATLGNIGDLLNRQLHVQHLASKLGLSEGLIARAVEDAMKEQERLRHREARRSKRIEQQQQGPGGYEEIPIEAFPDHPGEIRELGGFDTLALAHQEAELLRIIINHHDKMVSQTIIDGEEAEPDAIAPEEPILSFFARELAELPFENNIYEQLKLELIASHREHGHVNLHEYLNQDDSAIAGLVSKLLLPAHQPSENWRSKGVSVPDLDENIALTVRSALYHYQRRKVNKLLDELRQSMKTMTAENEDELFEMLTYLNQLRAAVTKKLGIIVE
jgi:DNA primase